MGELVPPKVEDVPTFLDHCICKELKNKVRILDPDKSLNYEAAISHHPSFEGLYVFDEFDLAPKVVSPPPWYTKEEQKQFKVHLIGTKDIIEADYQMQRIGLNGATTKTQDALLVGAMKKPIHPAREYFNALVWDGTPRLHKWLSEYCGATDDDPSYLAAIGTKWMCAAVARVMRPGCKFDNILIFEGDQDGFKSTTFRELATFEGVEYFLDDFSIANADNKDELMKLTGRLIVEIAELKGFGKREDAFFKSFISRQTDVFRTPYGRITEPYPRQFVLAGTYNPEGGVITDPTGARRYWFVKVAKKIDIAAIRANKKQMWAEAVHLLKGGEKLYLDDALKIVAADAAAKRRIVDDWNYDVMEAAGMTEFIEVRSIMKALGLDIQSRSSKESRRISSILRMHGYEYCRDSLRGKQVWGWKRPIILPKQKQLEIELPLVQPEPQVEREMPEHDDIDF